MKLNHKKNVRSVAENDYTASNCASCSVGKPHIILINHQAQTREEEISNTFGEIIPNIIPAGLELIPVGAQSIEEIAKNGACVYCGAPTSFFFPSCSSCDRAKSHIKLSRIGEDSDLLVDWSVSTGLATVSRHEIKCYLSSEEIEVGENSKAGICKAHKITLKEGSSLVSALGIEVRLEANSHAEEINATDVTLELRSRVGKVIVYDDGHLLIGEGATIDSLVLGKNVTIEIRGNRLLSKSNVIEFKERAKDWLIDLIRTVFMGMKNKGESKAALTTRSIRKGRVKITEIPVPVDLQKTRSFVD